MQRALQILQKHWHYDSFRPVQDNIIQSVLEGNDTFGLMPTGGGKSLCFQVPAMVNDGFCLVINSTKVLVNPNCALVFFPLDVNRGLRMSA